MSTEGSEYNTADNPSYNSKNDVAQQTFAGLVDYPAGEIAPAPSLIFWSVACAHAGVVKSTVVKATGSAVQNFIGLLEVSWSLDETRA